MLHIAHLIICRKVHPLIKSSVRARIIPKQFARNHSISVSVNGRECTVKRKRINNTQMWGVYCPKCGWAHLWGPLMNVRTIEGG